jgi:hypothetical protein
MLVLNIKAWMLNELLKVAGENGIITDAKVFLVIMYICNMKE